jgi:hypothetical protein
MSGNLPGNPNNICIIDNFMDKDDVKEIHRLCKLSFDNPEFPQWWYANMPCPEYVEYTSGNYRDLCMDGIKDYHEGKSPILKTYLDKAVKIISHTAGRKIVPIFHFCRNEWKTGSSYPPHCDSESGNFGVIDYLGNYSPSHIYESAIMDYTCNLYVNDDYEGGSLYFPEYDIQISHKPGQLVFFPGTVEYVHGISEVTKGTRWNLLSQLARPKMIVMHSMVSNLWSVLGEEQKKGFPTSWQNELYPPDMRKNSTNFSSDDFDK